MLFEHQLGPSKPAAKNVEPLFVPDEFRTALSAAVEIRSLVLLDGKLLAKLPERMRRQIANESDKAVKNWFVGITRAANTNVSFAHISLMRLDQEPFAPESISLSGRCRTAGSLPDGPLVAELVLETGERRTQRITAEGRFSFENVEPVRAVSLRVSVDHLDRYATLGRWFVPCGDRQDLVVELDPAFQNPNDDPPNPKDIVSRLDADAELQGLHAVHSRQVWPGRGKVKEFSGLSFSNNIGHLDCDRFFDNPDNCFRVVSVGSSLAVDSHVRPFEKYNFLMEAELGVRLGRSVEVISLGRNDGDVAASFPRIRDLAVKFHPDVILIEHSAYLMMQLHPKLLRRMHGYDAQHTHLENFYHDKGGALKFRPWSRDWPLHVEQPDTTELSPRIAFYDTLQVPFEHMHPLGRETYQYLADIMNHYKREFSSQHIFLQTGMDQAHAHGKYNRQVTLENGTEIKICAPVFLAYIDQCAAQNGFVCIHPALPDGFNDTFETYLTYRYDAHYSLRGHQWFARELTEKLLGQLGLDTSTNPRPPLAQGTKESRVK